MSSVDLKLMYEAYEELAEDYEVSKSDVSFTFQEVLEEYFGTPSILLQSKGLLVDGKYKNLRKYELDDLYQLLQTQLGLVRREGIKNYLTEIIIRNGGILYAKVVEYNRDKTQIILQPYMGKDRPLEHLRLIHKIRENKRGQAVKFPDTLTYVPVYIHFPLRFRRKSKTETHMYSAHAELMNRQVAKRHLAMLEETLNKEHDVVLNLRVVSFVNRVMLEFTSDYVLTAEIMGFIVRYFKSFDVIAYVKQ